MEERVVVGIFLVVAALGIVLGGMPANVTAETNASDNATIEVTVNKLTMVDISPNNMSFGEADPGSSVNNYSNDELGAGVSKTSFQIENIGSTNLTQVWLNVSQPTEDPFGKGNISLYDVGNFVAVKVNTTYDIETGNTNFSNVVDNNMSFVDRKEYNESYISYLELPDDAIVTHGRLRSGENEYFWALNGTTCTSTGSDDLSLVIGHTAHTATETGTTNLRTGSDITVLNFDGNAGGWNYLGADDYVDIDGSRYCVAASTDCESVRFYRWNYDAPGTCGASGGGMIFNGTTTGNFLPGASFVMDIELRIPYGVVAGEDLNPGQLYVIASSNEDS